VVSAEGNEEKGEAREAREHYIWAAMLSKLQRWWGLLGHVLVKGGGDGAMKGRRVRGVLFWRLAGISRRQNGSVALVLLRRRASVRHEGQWLNMQGRARGCANGILGVFSPRVCERK
jgi:hypothetical protein